MRIALLATALVYGCAPAAPHPQEPAHGGAAQQAHAPAKSPLEGSAKAAAKPAAPAALTLEPVPLAPLAAASFAIAEPRQGALIVPLEASAHPVSVRGAQGPLFIGLDEHPFRRIVSGSVRLGALLLEDEELAPGPHRLVVLQEGASGWVFAASTFLVGDEAQAPPSVAPPSGVVLLEPHGTYNGNVAADAVTIRAWSLGSGAPLLLRISGTGGSGSGVSAERRTNGEALRAVALPSGDFRIEVTELSTATGARAVPVGGRWSTMARVITVNRDAPVPMPAKGAAP